MHDDSDLLYKTAVLYYKGNMTQEEISVKLGISRPMVSRALSRAAAVGIVKIDVIPPKGVTELSGCLAKLLGLKEVIIAPAMNTSGSDVEDRLDDAAEFGAKYLEKAIDGETNIGIGWGMTVYKTIMNLDRLPKNAELRRFVPLVGSMGRNESHFQANAMVNTAASRLGGLAFYYNVSSLLAGDNAEAQVLKAKFSEVYQLWHDLDVAVIGLGACGPKPSFPISDYPKVELDQIYGRKAIGDILGRFFNKEGYIDLKYEGGGAYLGVPAEDLKKAKKIICLATGTSKIEGIITAARLGFFNVLVTDSRTASEMATYLEEKN
ncbi:MAG: sugar-binding domain-containing protein [Sphaerochaetaceae bacterium]|nr:sugar-binding domain-containing protein [Sphaerochaetaceae bacterium]MDD3162806.1 sugar-binding domain-containing protein [Sphaerochaetaceae bacterium]MDD4006869.1 sugar-binding domain-containing protein [Sphaerochaetaceae bacterium]MDD4396001.1 sugar-binding domain-containing protein [Sphaerochaetaceae bacterium]